MLIRYLLLGSIIFSLTACGIGDRLRPGAYGKPLRSERVAFDGIYFRARARHASEDRRDFTVTVRRADRNIAAALEAGNFEAVKYCLGLFGGSDILWSDGPEQDADAVSLTDSNNLMLTGRCTSR